MQPQLAGAHFGCGMMAARKGASFVNLCDRIKPKEERTMASEPIRDPAKDHLLTPKNSALIIIDYQPVQVNSIASMDRQLLVNNIVGVAKIGLAYGLPIIHSTVNVKTGLNK